MDFNETKQYIIVFKQKKKIKKNSLLFFFKKTETSVQMCTKTKQTNKIRNIIIASIFNKVFKNLFNHSILKLMKPTINCTIILFQLFNRAIINHIQSTDLFNLLTIKLNNRFYSNIQLKRTFTLNYINYKLFLFKVTVATLKKS